MYLYAKNDKGKISVSKFAVENGYSKLDKDISYIETSQEKIDSLIFNNKKKYHHFNYWYDSENDKIVFENIPFTEEEKEEAIKEEEEQAKLPPYRRPSLYNIMKDTEKIDSKADNISSNQLAQLLGTTGLYEDMNQSDLAIMMGLSEIYEVVNKEE